MQLVVWIVIGLPMGTIAFYLLACWCQELQHDATIFLSYQFVGSRDLKMRYVYIALP